MPRDPRATDELLAAYVDGVTELSADERRRVEARLAADPALRDDQSATRDLLEQLRELPPPTREPDWSTLEQSIADAVGPDAPVSWWRRLRWAVPALALATTAAVILVVMVRKRDGAEPPAEVAPIAHVTPSPAQAPEPLDTTFALYLDGSELQVEIEAGLEDELDDPLAGLEDPELVEGFMAPGDLALETIDELDDESLERVESWLGAAARDRG